MFSTSSSRGLLTGAPEVVFYSVLLFLLTSTPICAAIAGAPGLPLPPAKFRPRQTSAASDGLSPLPHLGATWPSTPAHWSNSGGAIQAFHSRILEEHGYQLKKRLAFGGPGKTVYEALSISTQQSVAVKTQLLSSEEERQGAGCGRGVGDPTTLKEENAPLQPRTDIIPKTLGVMKRAGRMEREFTALRRVQSAGVPRVPRGIEKFYSTDGSASAEDTEKFGCFSYLVMELVDGATTLADDGSSVFNLLDKKRARSGSVQRVTWDAHSFPVENKSFLAPGAPPSRMGAGTPRGVVVEEVSGSTGGTGDVAPTISTPGPSTTVSKKHGSISSFITMQALDTFRWLLIMVAKGTPTVINNVPFIGRNCQQDIVRLLTDSLLLRVVKHIDGRTKRKCLSGASDEGTVSTSTGTRSSPQAR